MLLTFESAEPLVRFFGIGFMLYKVLLTFESAEPLARFFGIGFMLYKVVLTFESVDELLKFDHPNELKLLGRTGLNCLLCCARWERSHNRKYVCSSKLFDE